MARQGKTTPRVSPAIRHAERVGTAELRGNLAKYLKQVDSGRPVVVQERGRDAYVLIKFAAEAPPSVLGCMRDRTEYVAGTVVNAAEAWTPGEMP